MGFHSTTSRATVILICFVVVFFARSIYTVAPELDGDAVRKWKSSQIIGEQYDFGELVRERHHSARWGINFPLAALINVGGFKVSNYTILPLLLYCGIFSMLMLFAIRKPFHGAALAALAVLLFYEPMFHRASNQPQPFVFGIFYITVSLWALSRYLEREKISLLLLSAVFAFLAYGAKETYVFFYPGLFLLLYFRGSFKACIVYGAALLVMLFGETLMFNAVSDELTFGRVEYLASGHHLVSMNKKAVYGSYPILDFILERWLRIPTINQVLSAISIGYFLILLLTRKTRNMDTLSLGVFALGMSYCFVLTFVPLKIDPLLAVQPLHPKYLTTTMPFFAFCTAYCLNDIISALRGRAKTGTSLAVTTVMVAFTAYAVVKESPFDYFSNHTYPKKDAFIWKHNQYIDEFNAAWDDGYGFCVKRWRSRKAIMYWLQFYLDVKGPDRSFQHSPRGGYKNMHSPEYDVNELKGFIQGQELLRLFPMRECDMKRLG